MKCIKYIAFLLWLSVIFSSCIQNISENVDGETKLTSSSTVSIENDTESWFKEKSESLEKSENLDIWIGEYSYFAEQNPFDDEHPTFMSDYHIAIFKEENIYFAKIEINGWMNNTKILAKIVGNDKYIDLFYEKDLENKVNEYKTGDRLISFARRYEDIIYTYWGELYKMETEHFFEKTEDIKD